MNMTNQMENNLIGGEAIAAGGFGCVFRPALKCEGASNRTSGVSKLLTKQYAKSEYDEIAKIFASSIITLKGKK